MIWIGLAAAAAVALALVLAFVGVRRSHVPAPPPPAPSPAAGEEPAAESQDVDFDDGTEVDLTMMAPGHTPKDGVRSLLLTPANPIVLDDDADDEPELTPTHPLILTSAMVQTDPGKRRARNEDSFLTLEDHSLYMVADGMGGYAGGALASSLAVENVERAFKDSTFPGLAHDNLPRRASELVRAIQVANDAIHARAKKDTALSSMGTTVCAARFCPQKQRLYIGHVGDSRVYRLRDGQLQQLTSDHSMAQHGVTGPMAQHLSRAVGIWPTVPVDVLLAKPMAGDVYLLCSDGLSRMVPDDDIGAILKQETPPAVASQLVAKANAQGGRDNITVIVVHVTRPADATT